MEASRPRFRVGVDENGLGPRLGPMVITAVLARVTTGEAWRIASRRARGALAGRLGDSKQLVAHGAVALGEAWARALAARGCGRPSSATSSSTSSTSFLACASPDDLVHAFAADDRAVLRAPCPSHVEAQCWSAEGDAFVAQEAQVRAVSGDLDRLSRKGLEIVAVRSVILCSKRMNEGVDAGKNRFVLDLHAMERLLLELRGIAGEDLVAVCGKVGGFGHYSDAFGPLAGRLHTVIEEGRARSAYLFPGLGEIAFVRDCDASDLCVGMASMVGKYLREALMGRIVRFYREGDPELPDASGYHDPVTTTFIEATRLARRARKVPDGCFERRAMDG